MHQHTFIAAGGGTGGSVSPLLAMLEMFPGARVHWIGTRGHWSQEQEIVRANIRDTSLEAKLPSRTEAKQVDPEAKLLARSLASDPSRSFASPHPVVFHSICSGKLRRYWDWRNLVDPLLVVLGFFQSLWIMAGARPCVVLTAGSYVAVPVAWAAWLLRIPVVVYQQDVVVGLANRLMFPAASLILSTHQLNLKAKSYQLKARTVGALLRNQVTNGSMERARKNFGLEKGLPTVLVLGGGTGSQFLNDLIILNLGALTKFCQIIHITGSRDLQSKLLVTNYQLPARYHPVPFFGPELADAYAVADVVVTRAGMGVLTELAANKKAGIVIPMPDTHQEANAALLEEHDAAVILSQSSSSLREAARRSNPDHSLSDVEGLPFIKAVHFLLSDSRRRAQFATNLHALFPVANKKEVVDLLRSHLSCRLIHRVTPSARE